MRYNYYKVTKRMQVYRFDQLFGFRNPNLLYTKVDIRIGNFTLHSGAEINRGITIEGIDLFHLIGKNLQVSMAGSSYRIMGVENG